MEVHLFSLRVNGEYPHHFKMWKFSIRHLLRVRKIKPCRRDPLKRGMS